jgi:hypothetical protein
LENLDYKTKRDTVLANRREYDLCTSHKKYHAFWKMYVIGLSDEILKKVYYKNALKIILGLDKTKFPE